MGRHKKSRIFRIGTHNPLREARKLQHDLNSLLRGMREKLMDREGLPAAVSGFALGSNHSGGGGLNP
jgi:hypothetical protein